MNLSRLVARRYLFSRESPSAVNIITLVSMIGVGIGVFSLFVVLSVFSGLKEMNLGLLSLFDPDIRISALRGKTFKMSDPALEAVFRMPEVRCGAFSLEEKVFLRCGQRETVARVKGVDSLYRDLSHIDSTVFVGQWLEFGRGAFSGGAVPLVLGNAVSSRLGSGPGDRDRPLFLYTPSPGAGKKLSESFSSVQGNPVGVFYLPDYDDKYVFTELAALQGFLNREGEASALEIGLAEGADADRVARTLRRMVGPDFSVQTRAEQQALFFRMMNVENAVLYLVFTLVLIIALFNVTGAVVMLVLDKRENIRTLYRLGASAGALKRIFTLEGLYVTWTGGGAGLLAAVLLVLAQQRWGFIMIEGAYRMPYPVCFEAGNLAIVVSTALLLGLISSRIAVKGFYRILQK